MRALLPASDLGRSRPRDMAQTCRVSSAVPYSIPLGRTARRVEWTHLPPRVRGAIEAGSRSDTPPMLVSSTSTGSIAPSGVRIEQRACAHGGGDRDHDQRRGRGRTDRFPEHVHEHRQGENRAAAADRADDEPDRDAERDR